MKKIIPSTTIATLLLIAFASCQKEIPSDNSEQALDKEREIHFIINTGMSSKSYMEYDSSTKKYTAKWKKGDVIGMVFGNEISEAKIAKTLSNTADDGISATFEGTLTASTSGSFQAVSPSSSVETFYTPDSEQCVLGFNVGDKSNNYKQHPTKGSFDSTCDMLISKSCTYSADELGTVTIGDLQFTRLLAILKVNLTGSYAEGEKISNLKIEGSTTLSGRARVKPSTYTINDWTVEKNYAWAEYTESDEMPAINSDAVYLMVNPQTIASGSTLTLTAETASNNISKTITLGKDFVLTAGKVTVLNIGITSTECTSKSIPKTLPYEESFGGTFGSFTVSDETLPAGLSYVWSTSSNNIKASGYVYPDKYAATSWLISPKIDLTSETSAVLTFSHAVGSLYEGTINDHIKLFVKEYGADSESDWKEKQIKAYPSGTSTTAYVINTTSLYSSIGDTIQIAFKYISTSDCAPNWCIKNLSVTKAPATTISFASSSVTMKVGDDPVSNPATSNSPATVTYESSNVSVATVDGSGNITAVANGTCTITASVVASEGFAAASTTCNVTVASSTTATLQLSSDYKFGDSATSKTDDKSNVWTYVNSGEKAGGSFQSLYSGQQFGTGSTNYYFTFTTPVPSGKTVKSVTITAAAGSTAPTYDISVDGSSWKSGNLSKDPTEYSGTGSCDSGNIVIKLDQNSGKKAVYLGKIVIVYE